MTFFTVNETPNPYQVDLRDRHTQLIKTLTGVSLSKASILAEYLQLRPIQDIPEAEMLGIGLTQAHIDRLKAAYQFGKSQFLGIHRLEIANVLDKPDIAAKPIQELIGDSRVEKGCLLILNIQNQLIHREVFSIGTETECLFNPRIVFETVLRHGGTRFIAGHNHPSESLEPSPEDLNLTQMLLDGCKVMELEMLDHLIVSRDRFSSIRQSSALWN